MKHLLPLLLLIIATSLSNEIKGVSPRADKGIFDLREMTDEEFLLKLNGEWEFYWKKLLRPHNFQTENLKPDLYGKIPLTGQIIMIIQLIHRGKAMPLTN